VGLHLNNLVGKGKSSVGLHTGLWVHQSEIKRIGAGSRDGGGSLCPSESSRECLSGENLSMR
jgi:hypothetical protein